MNRVFADYYCDKLLAIKTQKINSFFFKNILSLFKPAS